MRLEPLEHCKFALERFSTLKNHLFGRHQRLPFFLETVFRLNDAFENREEQVLGLLNEGVGGWILRPTVHYKTMMMIDESKRWMEQVCVLHLS